MARTCRFNLGVASVTLAVALFVSSPTAFAAGAPSTESPSVMLIYDAAQVASPPYDLNPWLNGRIDMSGGVSPYVVVVANEVARSVKGLPYAKKDMVEVGVVAVYDGYMNVHGKQTTLTPAEQLSLPEPTADQLTEASSEIHAAGLSLDNTDWTH